MPESLSAVQATLDRARRLGLPITPPVIRQEPAATTSQPDSLRVPPPRAGEGKGEGSAPLSSTPTASPATSFDSLIRQAAAREGLDPRLVKAVARAESNLDPTAVSAAGAKGLMQLMDGTARSLGVANSFDPGQNVAGGAKYLKQMLTRYHGDVKRALAAYNAGPGAVDAHGGIPPFTETRAYVDKVLNLARTGS
jgi:soluble lytic murein transglycosylase-like protein